jgi:hypothetical protein
MDAVLLLSLKFINVPTGGQLWLFASYPTKQCSTAAIREVIQSVKNQEGSVYRFALLQEKVMLSIKDKLTDERRKTV